MKIFEDVSNLQSLGEKIGTGIDNILLYPPPESGGVNTNKYTLTTCQICYGNSIINYLEPEESYYLLTFLQMMKGNNPSLHNITIILIYVVRV